MAILRLQAVSKTFQDGDSTIEALKATDFEVAAGKFVAIIGPSGSGKSTFLTIAGGLQTPTTGQVVINGRDYSQLLEKERARLRFQDIGFVLQSSNLIPFLSVEKQLDLVDKVNGRANKQRQMLLLEELGIGHLLKKLPKELSGGQRQRVAIARALYNDPALLLADEPTASLDTDRAIEVVELLAKECQQRQKAVIMVTHDERMTQFCDKVYEMRDGVLQEMR